MSSVTLKSKPSNKTVTDDPTRSVFNSILEALRSLPDEEQNQVVKSVIKDIALDRANKWFDMKQQYEKSGELLDQFISQNELAGVIAKEQHERRLDSLKNQTTKSCNSN